MTVIRVRLDDPASIERLRTVTDASLTQLSRVGGPLRDFDVDDAAVDDVIDAMEEMGWTVISLDPTDPITDDWDGMSNVATAVGQVMYSVDGLVLRPESPVTSLHGWVVNDLGLLLVK